MYIRLTLKNKISSIETVISSKYKVHVYLYKTWISWAFHDLQYFLYEELLHLNQYCV